ncbi:hypothetical protein D1872_330210 [compost metagenome]
MELAAIRANGMEADASRAIEMILGSPGIRRAEELADRFIEKALDALEGLPESKPKTHLKEIALFVNKRSY